MPNRINGDSYIQSAMENDKSEAGDVDINAEVEADVSRKSIGMATCRLDGDADADENYNNSNNNQQDEPANSTINTKTTMNTTTTTLNMTTNKIGY